MTGSPRTPRSLFHPRLSKLKHLLLPSVPRLCPSGFPPVDRPNRDAKRFCELALCQPKRPTSRAHGVLSPLPRELARLSTLFPLALNSRMGLCQTAKPLQLSLKSSDFLCLRRNLLASGFQVARERCEMSSNLFPRQTSHFKPKRLCIRCLRSHELHNINPSEL